MLHARQNILIYYFSMILAAIPEVPVVGPYPPSVVDAPYAPALKVATHYGDPVVQLVSLFKK